MKHYQLFRIHTEATGVYRQNVIDVLRKLAIPAYTLIDTLGVWNDTQESSLIVEIYASNESADVINGIAEAIRARNSQEAILVASFPVHTHLITGDTTHAKELTRA